MAEPKQTLVVSLVIIGVSILFFAGSASAQTVDSIEPNATDTDGDGLNDTLSVDIQVTNDGAATVVLLDGPVSSVEIPTSDDGSSQAPITNVSGTTATFGSTGYTGVYAVEADVSGASDGDTVEVTAWVGDTERSGAEDELTESVALSGTGSSEDGGGSAPSGEEDDPSDTGGGDSNGTDDPSGETGDGTDTTDQQEGESQPGFGLLAVLSALLVLTARAGAR